MTSISAPGTTGRRLTLFRVPFFTPMSPPLGLSLLKSFLARHGHMARCVDFNVDAKLWPLHHGYFELLSALSNRKLNDGYSKLWFVLNAHMQAFVNGGGLDGCERVLRAAAPLYSIDLPDGYPAKLHGLIVAFFDRLEELFDGLDLSDSEFIGASAYSTSLAPSLFLLRRAKLKYPQAKTIIGGGVFSDDLALGSANLEVLLSENPFIDHVIVGEGELQLLRLIDGSLEGRRVITVEALGKESLPVEEVPLPDFSDFDLDSYDHLTIEGGRSCPFQCSFCSETIQWGSYRKKSKALLASQMVELTARYGKGLFFMGDSLINPYVGGLTAELLSRNASLLFDGYLRADRTVGDAATVREWGRAGLYRARLGLETASTRLLGVMNKMTTPDLMSNVLRRLAEAGIRPTTYWIVGYPGETENDFEATLSFINEHHRFIYELEAHPYYYYPYGQVSSRLFKSYSVYPAEITDLVKFNVWEVADVVPSREERYARLERLSDFVSNLGVPNIYTLSDRFSAEERWRTLWPAARDVY